MLDAFVQNAARRDLIDIWCYGLDQWDEAQADTYLSKIEAAIQLLCENPGLGVDCSDIRAEYRRWKVGSHHIYYIVAETRIEIIRVLGSRQDAQARLAD